MKKISVVLASVLLCTQVFAGGTIRPKTTAASASAVVKAAESKIVKVYYKSETAGRVDVSIINSKGEEVFNESIAKTDGFIRPYNFEQLPEGEYTVSVKDKYGKMVEKISYANFHVQKLINVRKLADEDKYLVTVTSNQKMI